MSFTVYKSSAGSGKTYTLVKEYLKIVLLEPFSFRSILAITFTNKAANEMKDRIIGNLQSLSKLDINKIDKKTEILLNALTSETGLKPEIITQRATKVLELILHNYSDFAIGTIDSFVYKIIRTFAFDLHIPINFDIELETDEIISQTIDILLNKVGSDENLTRTLVRFTEAKTENDQNWNIEFDLKSFSSQLFNENAQSHINKLKELSLENFNSIYRKINAAIKDFENSVYTCAVKPYELILQKAIPNNAFYQGEKGIAKYFENLYNKQFDKIVPNSYVNKTINENKWYAGKANESEMAAIDSVKEQILSAFNDILDTLSEHFDNYKTYLILSKNIFPLALLNEIEKVFHELKSQNNIVHISEFNKRISEIVFNEPVPFIYERLGEKYRHFMIDEFQDTSVLQWQNLLPLIDNSLAEGNFNMLVGDGKQAIYRWRNGEVEQFAKLPEIYKKEKYRFSDEREQNLIRNYKAEILNNNFRSKAEIVKFNNDFFNFVSELLPEKFNSIYSNLEQDHLKENAGGYVQFNFIEKDNSEFSSEDLNFIKIHEIILETIDHNFTFEDIAILCRNNSEASRVARYLIENKINVISSESLLLYKSPEVSFLLAFLKFILKPDDKISQTEIINFLLQNEKIEGSNLNAYLINLKNISESITKTEDYDKNFINLIKKSGFKTNLNELNFLPVFDLCEKLIREFFDKEDVNPYLQFFLDSVLKFTTQTNTNLSEFLEWWEKNKKSLSLVIPEGINAVKIMTIHKAKGLEFPVVIFPFANEKLNVSRNSIWVDYQDENLPELKTALFPTNKDLEETKYAELYIEEKNKSFLDLLNLLYVVMTRPSERLYVLSPLPPKNSNNISLPILFSEFLKKTGDWSETESVYSFGEKAFYLRSKEKHGEENFKLNSFISNEWRNKMLISKLAPDVWDVEYPEKNKQWGNLVHNVLSQIFTIEDVDETLNSLLLNGILDNEEKIQLSKITNQLISNPDINQYFQKGLEIKNEVEILLTDGKSIRPDRLVFKDDELIIIDYKTGSHKESDTKQIKKYGNILYDLGYKNIKKVLIYINNENCEIVEI
ncbi:MAG: UvrD-helicase domain-containing protein [Bacteroidales bacterium]|nr:UvrD-helicase domain-containing protein [Bacteroidales bacterium]